MPSVLQLRLSRSLLGEKSFIAAQHADYSTTDTSRLENVPGTVLLNDEAAHAEEKTHDLKHGTGKDAHIVLSPQPSEDPNDPLNWPMWRKELIIVILSLGAMLHAGTNVSSHCSNHKERREQHLTAAGTLPERLLLRYVRDSRQAHKRGCFGLWLQSSSCRMHRSLCRRIQSQIRKASSVPRLCALRYHWDSHRRIEDQLQLPLGRTYRPGLLDFRLRITHCRNRWRHLLRTSARPANQLHQLRPELRIQSRVRHLWCSLRRSRMALALPPLPDLLRDPVHPNVPLRPGDSIYSRSKVRHG